MQVFIVDDSSLVRQRLEELLDGVANVEIVGQARSATEAMATIPRVHPDFIILDIRMPDGDGLMVLAALKLLDRPPLVGILTNYAIEQYRKKCAALGADFFWDKSKDFAAIPAALQSLSGRPPR